jgi:hypothetical protein
MRGVEMNEPYGIIVAEEVEQEDREQELIDREQEAMETLQEDYEDYTFKYQRTETENYAPTYTVTIFDNDLGKPIFSAKVDYIKTDQVWNEAEEVEEFVIRIPLPDDYFDEEVSDQE